jgi:hypothetical protein
MSGWIFLLLLMLASCHTERKTQRDINNALSNQDAFAQLGNYWQILHPCINDTTTKEIVRYVQGKPERTTDTIRKNDTVYITNREVIHDTLYKDKTHTVIDGRALQQANDSIAKYKVKSAGLWADSIHNAQLYQSNLKAEKKKTSKANWRFVWACIAVGVLVFKKPLLSLATGGWSKILKLLKLV